MQTHEGYYSRDIKENFANLENSVCRFTNFNWPAYQWRVKQVLKKV